MKSQTNDKKAECSIRMRHWLKDIESGDRSVDWGDMKIRFLTDYGFGERALLNILDTLTKGQLTVKDNELVKKDAP